jgi:hypothetical protein
MDEHLEQSAITALLKRPNYYRSEIERNISDVTLYDSRSKVMRALLCLFLVLYSVTECVSYCFMMALKYECILKLLIS